MTNTVRTSTLFILGSLASVGYFTLALLLLQALALPLIAALQYVVFNHMTAEDTSATGTLDMAVSWYTVPLYQAKPEEPSIALTIGLWSAAFIVMMLIVAYCGTNVSRLLHKLLRRYGRHTAPRLFLLKLTLTMVAFGVILIAALLLPAVKQLLAINTILAAIGIASFWLQHYLGMRYKLAAKHIL